MSQPADTAAERRSTLPEGADRRVWVRTPCSLPSTCQPVPLPTAAKPEHQWHGEIQDLSAGGIKLVLVRRFEPGTPLILELPGGDQQAVITRSATVVHVTPLNNSWVLGCRFDVPLTASLLDVFLQPKAAAPPRRPESEAAIETVPEAAQSIWK